ncbi:MAG: hypothetical protein NTZ28_07640, partial [Nitrospirae bacterium]|nr:hypothetical protein [Nitrospirota bacterium]
ILVLRPSRHAVCLHAPSLGPRHADVEGKIGKWRNDLSLGKILDGAIRDIGTSTNIWYTELTRLRNV